MIMVVADAASLAHVPHLQIKPEAYSFLPVNQSEFQSCKNAAVSHSNTQPDIAYDVIVFVCQQQVNVATRSLLWCTNIHYAVICMSVVDDESICQSPDFQHCLLQLFDIFLTKFVVEICVD